MKDNHQIIAYIGKIGAGKTYQMLKRMEHEKGNGNSVAIVSFADPFKQFIKEKIGLLKTGALGTGPLVHTATYKQFLYEDLHNFIMDSLFYVKDRLEDRSVFNHFSSKFDLQWDLHSDELVEHIRECVAGHDYNAHFRRIMQIIGTEFGRAMCFKIWTYYLEERIARICAIGAIHTLFVDDVRFWNEYNTVKGLPYPTQIWGVITCAEVRARRRGVTVEQVAEADSHSSEADIEDMLATVPDTLTIWNN